jgi:hypothetical protein
MNSPHNRPFMSKSEFEYGLLVRLPGGTIVVIGFNLAFVARLTVAALAMLAYAFTGLVFTPLLAFILADLYLRAASEKQPFPQFIIWFCFWAAVVNGVDLHTLIWAMENGRFLGWTTEIQLGVLTLLAGSAKALSIFWWWLLLGQIAPLVLLTLSLIWWRFSNRHSSYQTECQIIE